MPKPIIWSPLSVSDIENIIEYLNESWNKQVVSNFLDEVALLLNQIALHPRQFPVVNKKLKVRKCVVTKHNSIFIESKRIPFNCYAFLIQDKTKKKIKLK